MFIFYYSATFHIVKPAVLCRGESRRIKIFKFIIEDNARIKRIHQKLPLKIREQLVEFVYCKVYSEGKIHHFGVKYY